MIRKEKHIEIRLRVLEQLDEMLGLLKTGDEFPRASQSDNTPYRPQAARSISRRALHHVQTIRRAQVVSDV
jgi:hypothetical protein